MSVTNTITAAVDLAILDADQLQEVTFAASYQQASSASADYDPATGVKTNSNPFISTKVILPGAVLSELDGESVKSAALEGIVLRSWLPGVEASVDDRITVSTGVFAGTYVVATVTESTIAHFSLALRK